MEQKMITQQEKTAKEMRAEEKVRRAQAELAKIRRDKKKELRKAQDHHKFVMGGIVVKYFPEAYDFSEQEMNRIIACAFSLKDVKNMVNTVVKERPDPEPDADETELADTEIESEEDNENNGEESDDDESEV